MDKHFRAVSKGFPLKKALFHEHFFENKEDEKNMERFENSVCKCDHIKEGTCKQCSACDRCEFYSQKIPFAEEVVCRIVGNGFYVGNHYVRFCK